MHSRARALAFAIPWLAAALLSGCGLTLDLDPPDPQGGFDGGAIDGGRDAAAPSPCEGRPDGERCSDTLPLICVGGSCEVSRCGDGVVDADAGELCDDANEIAADGCEPIACAPTCTEDASCDDANECNGAERCDPDTHKCTAGEPPPDDVICTPRGGGEGSCSGGTCVPFGCGNGEIEDDEECDDGNPIAGDGCEPDCTRSCEADVVCQDGDRCNGAEVCDHDRGCVAGEPPLCVSPDACHAAMCSPREGCEVPLVDLDHDGHASVALGACGDDCDDTDPARYGGAPERCNRIDDDCDGAIDESMEEVACYADADFDGFGDDASRTMACSCPADSVSRGGDCFDVRNPIGAAVRPSQTEFFRTPYCRDPSGTDCSFDYDCDGEEERQLEAVHQRCSALTVLQRCTGQGWRNAVPACGEDGVWVECDGLLGPLGLLCTARDTRRVQHCR